MANLYNVPDLGAGCPWAGWSRPNIKWCEDNLCAWVTAPANTWSNLAFIVLGIVMWRLAKRSGHRSMLLFGPASIVVGATSFLYHMSYTFVFQFGDFIGMFVFIDLMVSFNQRRLGTFTAANHAKVYLGEVIISSLLVPLCFWIEFPIQALVLISVLWGLGLEVQLLRRARSSRPDAGRYTTQYKWLLGGLGCAVAGVACSVLDKTGVWCDPHNHIIQGHAVWHLFTASSLMCLYFFYDQFDFDSGAAIARRQ